MPLLPPDVLTLILGFKVTLASANAHHYASCKSLLRTVGMPGREATAVIEEM
jgi:hypothetical protein